MQDSIFDIMTYETEFCPFCGKQMKLVGRKHTDKYGGETIRYWEKECINPMCRVESLRFVRPREKEKRWQKFIDWLLQIRS